MIDQSETPMTIATLQKDRTVYAVPLSFRFVFFVLPNIFQYFSYNDDSLLISASEAAWLEI